MTDGPPPPDVRQRLAEVRDRIELAGGDPEQVVVVAVTKGVDASRVESAIAAGLADFGENYAAELLGKDAILGGIVPRWHFLGSIQRNKVPRLAPVVACWQGVSRVEEARSIVSRAAGSSLLVEVDIAGTEGRNGAPPDKVSDLVHALSDAGCAVDGLMTIGVRGSPDLSRRGFQRVAALADELDLPVRSMGMSDDLELAVAAGSTMVRIGRGLFGDRPPPERRAQ